MSSGVPGVAAPTPADAGDDDPFEPNIARVNDYWLGGTHHGPQDKQVADHFALVAPHIPYLVRAKRAMLGRLVRHLHGQGIRQFLDLGSGIPAQGHVHEIAAGLSPASRVVYVDIDPGVVEDGARLLDGTSKALYLLADFREPERILEAPEVRGLLDLDEPVAVLFIESLIHLPDSDDPGKVVATFAEAVSSGSYVAISHFSENEELLQAFEMFERMMLGTRPEVNLRSPEQIEGFLSGLQIVPPGVVQVPLWNPDSTDEVDRKPENVQMHVGLARKP